MEETRTTYRTHIHIPELGAAPGDILHFKRVPGQRLWLMRRLDLSALETLRFHAYHLELIRAPEGMAPLPPAVEPPSRRTLKAV